MAACATPVQPKRAQEMGLEKVATFPGLRVLAWDRNTLYASKGYTLLRGRWGCDSGISWDEVASFHCGLLRSVSSSFKLTARLFRDGFHALAVHPDGDLIAAVPGAILRVARGDSKFEVTHQGVRGTRPLHIAATRQGQLYWGEYFDNASREAVHIYGSCDRGAHWDVAYTFPARAIRHVHNVVYDQWSDCLWILTGDVGSECRVLRASCDFRVVETIFCGRQQARAVALVPTADAVYFSSDTPFEENHIYRLDRCDRLTRVGELASSSIYGCRVGGSIFFSTMAEPSQVNTRREVHLYESRDGLTWKRRLTWQKDLWPMNLFQYGNVFLPDGNNECGILALTTIAVQGAGCETSLWQLASE